MSSTLNTAPQTLTKLKQLFSAIEAGDSPITLGKAARHILGALITLPEQAAFSTISELADRHNVSASTLSRLSRRLGYSGFAQLQDVFRRSLTQDKSFYSKRVSQLLDQHGSDHDGLTRMTELTRQESDNLAELTRSIDATSLSGSAELLAQAPRIRIHGVRQFSSLAMFMAYGLGMLRNDVAMLDSSHQGIADGLAQLNSGDVLVVASCYPYTPSVLATAEIAARHHIRIIALTDAISSPLCSVAEHSFLVPNHSLFFSNSMCAFMLLIESLLSEVASLLGDNGLISLQRREHLISELKASL
ncbi:MurR/RpiR family transcriptional regulator [Halomonas halocynthiae]|uniref:MurR/RpiR family transcriptional regulator n=1 Tax=Halomonas halocynthiae TaxID=176290 RepID=UPI00040C0DD2|nr:MurR/RpiR family transcriptional regulator [Halomonas halocynthiae]